MFVCLNLTIKCKKLLTSYLLHFSKDTKKKELQAKQKGKIKAEM